MTTLFVPSSRLLTAAGDDQKARKFILSSGEWFDLQNRVQAILALPSDLGEYQERYGDASSGLQMKECFDAMRTLQQVAGNYGNPRSLRAKILKDPNFLASADRPRHDAYSATVWTLELAHQNAFSLASALSGIPASARGETQSSIVSGIKSLFLGPNQIVDNMQHTVDQLDALVNEFQEIEKELESAQLAMKTFTDQSSKTRASLDKEIGELTNKIAQLEKDRDAAYGKWLALTISACAVPAIIAIVGIVIMVLLAVPTGGASFAVGSAVTGAAVGLSAAALGIAAGIARTSYEDLIKQVDEKQEFLKKRTAYRCDLGALDNLMKFSLPTSSEIISQLRVVKDAWTTSLQEIRYTVADLGVDGLTSGPWLKQAEMAAAAANWSRVDDALRAFTVGSFVDSNVIAFGAPLPKDDPQWQKKLVAMVAA